MSAGAPVADRDMGKLAPKFRAAVERALLSANANGLDAYVYEAYRSAELQALYYTRGRPPTPEYPKPVTYARSNLFSWHGYSLAVDVISRLHRWDRPEHWWAALAEHFKREGCKWGGDWKQRDLPHFQFGTLKPSPSDRARQILATEGMEAVWRVVGAI
jgi:peptidoglycan LD-endopeptidase CwlK